MLSPMSEALSPTSFCRIRKRCPQRPTWHPLLLPLHSRPLLPQIPQCCLTASCTDSAASCPAFSAASVTASAASSAASCTSSSAFPPALPLFLRLSLLPLSPGKRSALPVLPHPVHRRQFAALHPSLLLLDPLLSLSEIHSRRSQCQILVFRLPFPASPSSYQSPNIAAANGSPICSSSRFVFQGYCPLDLLDPLAFLFVPDLSGIDRTVADAGFVRESSGGTFQQHLELLPVQIFTSQQVNAVIVPEIADDIRCILLIAERLLSTAFTLFSFSA